MAGIEIATFGIAYGLLTLITYLFLWKGKYKFAAGIIITIMGISMPLLSNSVPAVENMLIVPAYFITGLGIIITIREWNK